MKDKLSNSKRSDEDANKLFEENYKLIFYTINKEWPNLFDDDDLKQIAAIGLWKACRGYDDTVETKFSSYAYKCITSEVYRGYFRPLYKNRDMLKECLDTVELNETIAPSNFILEKPINELLTKRQLDVLRLVSKGLTTRQIGPLMGVSRTIISKERRIIERKLKDNIIYI